MCGIAGFIGKSKDNNISFKLLTSLFSKNESRGIDASGFWLYDGKEIVFSKIPIKSSKFVNTKVWQQVRNIDCKLILTHSRGATVGYGDCFINSNNHPFTYNRIGLIHNGKLDINEFNLLKNKYDLTSNCDSELLLKIIVGESSVIKGIEKVYSFLKNSHFAVALTDVSIDESLWLFRNKHRPLWILDLREFLGQIYFLSDPELFIKAINENPDIKFIKKYSKLFELKPYEIIQINNNKIICYNLEKKSEHKIYLKDLDNKKNNIFYYPNQIDDYYDFNKFFENINNIKKRQDFFNDKLKNIVKEFNEKIKTIT